MEIDHWSQKKEPTKQHNTTQQQFEFWLHCICMFKVHVGGAKKSWMGEKNLSLQWQHNQRLTTIPRQKTTNQNHDPNRRFKSIISHKRTQTWCSVHNIGGEKQNKSQQKENDSTTRENSSNDAKSKWRQHERTLSRMWGR